MFDVYKFVDKPWGSETWLALNDKYCFKIIKINAGHKTSLQYHEKKEETGYIHSGKALVSLESQESSDALTSYEVVPGDVINLKPGEVHRFEALEDLVMFEVSTPEVEDVVRLTDVYGRK